MVYVSVVEFIVLLCQVDNDDYVRRVLKTDDTKPATKSEPQRETSSRSKVNKIGSDHLEHPLCTLYLEHLAALYSELSKGVFSYYLLLQVNSKPRETQ